VVVPEQQAGLLARAVAVLVVRVLETVPLGLRIWAAVAAGPVLGVRQEMAVREW
jgi:hypothetical protein